MDVENFHKRLKELYLPPTGEFILVDVPEIRFAAIDGRGDPAEEEGRAAVKWLFSLAHAVKPIVKAKMGKNFVEPPLEYLYWADDMESFLEGRTDQWNWRVMVVFVDWITEENFQESIEVVAQKLGQAPRSLRLVNIHEGRCAQTMHVGDYQWIAKTCDRLYHHFLPEKGLTAHGCYHEIYLNDPLRTASEKRRVVIRQPVRDIYRSNA